MVKLVILIEESEDTTAFNAAWPGFLRLAESMPGVIRETFGRVESVLFSHLRPSLMYELYFDTFTVARLAMASPNGREAGRLLQQISGGKVTLFLADHKEEDIKNIRGRAAA